VSRARRVAAAAALLVLAAAAVWLGSRLWATDVPGGLAEPPVDVDATFGARAVDRAESFESVLRVLALLGQVTLVGTLALYAWRGVRFARESAAGPIGTGFLLGMLGYAIVWLVQVPFLLVEVWWLRRHDVTEASYLDALFGDLAELGSQFLFVCFALLVAMGLARLLRRCWWIPASGAFVALLAAYVFLSPYLLAGLPDASPRLRAEAARLADAEGLDDHPPVEIMEVREFTSQPNAFATGLGASQRVVLFDTLAEDFPRDEVRSVLAHEVGHLAHHHIAKTIGWFALVVLPTAFLVSLVTRRRGGLGEPAAVPLALLVVVILSLVSAPLQNAASRRYEAEADWTALQATRNPAAMIDLHRNFTRRGLADPDPPGWWQVLFGSHPSGSERVAMARAWEDRQR
jgi:STE24 endopeptidase